MSAYHLLFYDYDGNFICYLKDHKTDFITFTYNFKESGTSTHSDMIYMESLIGVQCVHGTLEQVKSNITDADFKLLESGSFKMEILTSGEIRKLKIKKLLNDWQG
jgi:hypothetical protein